MSSLGNREDREVARPWKDEGREVSSRGKDERRKMSRPRDEALATRARSDLAWKKQQDDEVTSILYEMCFNVKGFWQSSLLHDSLNITSKDHAA